MHVVNKAGAVISVPVILAMVVWIVRLPLSSHLCFKSLTLGAIELIIATIPVIADIDTLIVPVARISAELPGAA